MTVQSLTSPAALAPFLLVCALLVWFLAWAGGSGRLKANPIGVLLVIPAVRAASKAVDETRRAEDRAHSQRPLPPR